MYMWRTVCGTVRASITSMCVHNMCIKYEKNACVLICVIYKNDTIYTT